MFVLHDFQHSSRHKALAVVTSHYEIWVVRHPSPGH